MEGGSTGLGSRCSVGILRCLPLLCTAGLQVMAVPWPRLAALPRAAAVCSAWRSSFSWARPVPHWLSSSPGGVSEGRGEQGCPGVSWELRAFRSCLPVPQSLQPLSWCPQSAQPSQVRGARGAWLAMGEGGLGTKHMGSQMGWPVPFCPGELWPALPLARRSTEPRPSIKMPSPSKSSSSSLSISTPLPSMWPSSKAGEDLHPQGYCPPVKWPSRVAASLSLQICLCKGLDVDLEVGP